MQKGQGRNEAMRQTQLALLRSEQYGLRTETIAPFDLSGTSGSKANRSDSLALTNGAHTITATFARPDGTYRTITSTFTVSN